MLSQQPTDLAPLKDPAVLFGIAVVLFAVGKTLHVLIPVFRGGGDKEDGRWQGETTQILRQQTAILEGLREEAMRSNQLIASLAEQIQVQGRRLSDFQLMLSTAQAATPRAQP